MIGLLFVALENFDAFDENKLKRIVIEPFSVYSTPSKGFAIK